MASSRTTQVPLVDLVEDYGIKTVYLKYRITKLNYKTMKNHEEDVLSIFDKVKYSELSEREKQIYNQGAERTNWQPLVLIFLGGFYTGCAVLTLLIGLKIIH